jgi:Glycosyl transferases group 1
VESVTVVTEPLLHPDFVQFEIVVPILERLRDRYDLTVAAPSIGPLVRERLESRGIRAADGGAYFPPLRRSRDEIPSYVASWARDAVWGRNRRGLERALAGVEGARVNVSMTTAIDADAWLIQSRPLGMALDAMRHSVNGGALRTAVTAAAPVVGHLDEHHLLDAGRRAHVRYATTQHVADWFDSRGLPVEDVLPMYYRPSIRPSTANPSRDSVLVYVGKETDTTALRMLLDTGLPVTMFGSKSVGWVVKALQLQRYPHAQLLGHVTDQELSGLYSNARFTAFPFTEEPFGLIPLESMACGTPILTYGDQGPGESVLDGRTGWLVRSPDEFVRKALQLWNAGAPPSSMVAACLQRATRYHIDTVQAGWNSLFHSASIATRSGAYAPRPRTSRSRLPLWLGGSALPRADPLSPRTARRAPESPFVRPLLPTETSLEPASAPAPEVDPFARSGGYPGRSEDGRVGWTLDDEPFATALQAENESRSAVASTTNRVGPALARVSSETANASTS